VSYIIVEIAFYKLLSTSGPVSRSYTGLSGPYIGVGIQKGGVFKRHKKWTRVADARVKGQIETLPVGNGR